MCPVVLRDACFSSSNEQRAFSFSEDFAAAVLATREASKAMVRPCRSCHSPSRSAAVESCSCWSFSRGALALLLISTAARGIGMSVTNLHGTVRQHARSDNVLLLSAVQQTGCLSCDHPIPNHCTSLNLTLQLVGTGSRRCNTMQKLGQREDRATGNRTLVQTCGPARPRSIV